MRENVPTRQLQKSRPMGEAPGAKEELGEARPSSQTSESLRAFAQPETLAPPNAPQFRGAMTRADPRTR